MMVQGTAAETLQSPTSNEPVFQNLWGYPHRMESRLHPLALIVIANLVIVALGVTASFSLVSSPDTPEPEALAANVPAAPAAPIAPPAHVRPASLFSQARPASVTTATPRAEAASQPVHAYAEIRPPALPKPVHVGHYALRFGPFAGSANTSSLETALKRRGYTPVVIPLTSDGRTLHEVHVGDFPDREAAAHTASTLRRQAGLSPKVIKVATK